MKVAIARGFAYLRRMGKEAPNVATLDCWVEDNVAWVFDFQLSAWTENEASWPENRDLKTFREWFRVDIHSVVVDVADDDIEGEEL